MSRDENPETILIYDSYTMESPNIKEDRYGFLLCTDCVIARSGRQFYKGSDLKTVQNLEPTKTYYVDRSADQLFTPKNVDSFNGAVFTDGHPGGGAYFLDSETFSGHEVKGSVFGVRKSEETDADGNALLIGSIKVFDPELKDAIKSGRRRELSAGYYGPVERIDEHGFFVYDMWANHVALVPEGRENRGRAGPIARINDSTVIDVPNLHDSIQDKGGAFYMPKTAHIFNYTGTDLNEAYPTVKTIEVEGTETQAQAEAKASELLTDIKSGKVK